MKKVKVLCVNECSYLSSGYARYGHNLLSLLNQDERLEIAEMGTFFNPYDNKMDSIPWIFYANFPGEGVSQEDKINFLKDVNCQMGYAMFDQLALEYRPDVVINFTDFWSQRFINNSPFRKCFKSLWLAPHDSIPQNLEWIEEMTLHDGVLTYSDWALDEIKKASPKVKLYGSVPPLCEPVFVPMNKKACRESLELNPNCKFVGTTMRNQFRKLFPNLFRSFKMYLDQTGVKDTFLYCHTSYPDGSWNIPDLIHYYDVANYVVFTYVCHNCKHVFADFYSDNKTCTKCGNITAKMPSTDKGVSVQELAKIYNVFDCYVQYSNCLARGELVQTSNGWKKIEDIKIGEMVLTHKSRYMKVLNTFEKPSPCKMFNIKLHENDDELNLTSEHPVLAFSRTLVNVEDNERSIEKWLVEQSNQEGKDKPEPSFVKVENLHPGDLLCKAIDSTNVESGEFCTKKTNTVGMFYKNYVCYKVKSITPIDYKDSVFNIEVEEDNSYTMKCSSVHNSEGFGLPQLEATSCAVPLMATDYSAMSDIVRKVGGQPIKVLYLQTEFNTGCTRAIPDDNHFVELLTKFFKKPTMVRNTLGYSARNLTYKNYSWEKTAQTWSNAILSVAQENSMWYSPVSLRHPAPYENRPMRNGEVSNSEYVEWLLREVAFIPEKLGTMFEAQLIRDLNYEMTTGSFRADNVNEDSILFNDNKLSPFSREKAWEEMKKIGDNINKLEELRGIRLGL